MRNSVSAASITASRSVFFMRLSLIFRVVQAEQSPNQPFVWINLPIVWVRVKPVFDPGFVVLPESGDPGPAYEGPEPQTRRWRGHGSPLSRGRQKKDWLALFDGAGGLVTPPARRSGASRRWDSRAWRIRSRRARARLGRGARRRRSRRGSRR